MSTELSRRAFVKGALAGSMAVAGGVPAYGAEAGPPAGPAAPPAAKDALPKGKIGKLEISRILLGGNLLTHYTHSRDLKYVYALAKHYNTEAKVLETLAVAEANGVNALVIHTVPEHLAILRKHRKERGGKIQWIICPTAPVESDVAKYRQEVESLVKDGCEAIYLWGVHADALVKQDRVDLVAKAVAVAKEFGVPSGVGGHSLEVVKACEQNGVNADFYIKTFHHHDYPTGPKPEQLKPAYSEFPGYWCKNPEETAEFMKTVRKPWIAFKTMAAGAIPPPSAFECAFVNGADFVLAGMFDFEIAEDVQIAKDTAAKAATRARPWVA